MGWHAVLERLKVGLERLQVSVPAAGRAVQVVLVQVQPLPAGHQLGAAEEQVERVGVTRVGRVRMGVERPLAHRVAHNEQEIGTVLCLRPLAQPAFVLGRKVRLAAAVLAPLLQDKLLRVGEVDRGKLRRCNGQPGLQQRQLGRVVRLQVGQDAAYHLREHGHDIPVVLDESQLDVQADIFVDVPDRVVRLCTEDWSHFEDPLEHAHHDLLVELRALREIGLSLEVLDAEHVRAPFGRGLHQFWRLDLGESQVGQGRAKAGHHARGQAKQRTLLAVAQPDHRMIEEDG